MLKKSVLKVQLRLTILLNSYYRALIVQVQPQPQVIMEDNGGFIGVVTKHQVGEESFGCKTVLPKSVLEIKVMDFLFVVLRIYSQLLIFL